MDDGAPRRRLSPKAQRLMHIETAVSPAGSGGPIVRLIALDTRQIDLGLVAGYEEPSPAAGPHALGRVPGRGVVAVFNGAAPAREDERVSPRVQSRLAGAPSSLSPISKRKCRRHCD